MDLKEISDRLEIQDLMVSYCYAIDGSDWDALDALRTASISACILLTRV